MTNYLHREFMALNKKGVDEFKEPLTRQIKIFDELEAQLVDTVKEDKEVLLKKLKDLDQEIYENMLDEYEDLLENNEVLEEKPDKKPESVKKPEPAKKPEPVKLEPVKSEPVANKPKSSDDEAVLEMLYSKGLVQNLSRTYLKNNGFKGDLSSWEIKVGKYMLKRTSLFLIRFRLIKAAK